MRFGGSPKSRIAAGLFIAVVLGVGGYFVLQWRIPGSPGALLEQADKLSWNNNWIAAEPLYEKAELEFAGKHQDSKALYAKVSEYPAKSESSVSLPEQIAELTTYLSLPAGQEPETRLRILTILGMLETNYDAGLARDTWGQVKSLAKRRGHYLLAARASGEQGIAAFLLGDLGTAKKNVLQAWAVAKIADPAAHVRYASVYGVGLVELHKYKDALAPLDEAIHVAESNKNVAYPTIAVTAKIGALGGLGRTQEALTLASGAIQRVSQYSLAGHLFELYQTRAGVYENSGRWSEAIKDYVRSVEYAQELSYWRGLGQVSGSLALAYLQIGDFDDALASVNKAINANKQIPDELYFVPRNLAIKARILAKRGNLSASNELYDRSMDLIDVLLSSAPTPGVERDLLSQLNQVYSGYFDSLCAQKRLSDAFTVIERAHGRIEAQALKTHNFALPHQPSPAERYLTTLDLKLLDTENSMVRRDVLTRIETTEQQIAPDSKPDRFSTEPVKLRAIQNVLQPTELMIEYVLGEPTSYALVIDKDSVHTYPLKGSRELEPLATAYRSELIQQKVDLKLARELFDDLLAPIQEYTKNTSLLIVPDGILHLLPFSALHDRSMYVIASRDVSVIPSGTVLKMIREPRGQGTRQNEVPYLGVAAWTNERDYKPTLLSRVFRRGERGNGLTALPESRREVETIAQELPKPGTVLLGSAATKSHFQRLPLQDYKVLHLALHGFADVEHPDRSALAFAPEDGKSENGLLEVGDIRHLNLNANLVTLSACNTSLGPVGESGVANVVNAFIEAGARTVISTMWEEEDHAAAHLMTEFYGNLVKGEEKEHALREAQLQMLESGDPPYYWAGFVTNGDPSGQLFKSELRTQGVGGNGEW